MDIKKVFFILADRKQNVPVTTCRSSANTYYTFSKFAAVMDKLKLSPTPTANVTETPSITGQERRKVRYQPPP